MLWQENLIKLSESNKRIGLRIGRDLLERGIQGKKNDDNTLWVMKKTEVFSANLQNLQTVKAGKCGFWKQLWI